ncbi:MAG: hypothetical protein A3K19_20130 [Lentisphaerae bacterium RIFOXYB12_FULL_65_16]|nr:MAG: hypothetical protein A3K18_11210 [Lentisphaerae bacterium RIFOXYA12_64_32]OGV91771.1 MAG: hypothetical protein A3K19_20130 [Lentisphaerae bacterium RIFOXYB12_FULL_65_16]
MELTLKKIAAMLDVSPATVSLALKQDPRVAARTGERVRTLARELGYVPNNLGRALQSRRSGLVAYMLADIAGSFFNEILQGIGEVATEHGYGLMVGVTRGCAASEETQLRLFREKRVDGIVVSSGGQSATRDQLLRYEERGVPVIVCSSETFDARIPHVLTDNEAGGRLAAEHLIGLGHRRLAYFGPSLAPCRRYDGCAVAALAHGLAPVPRVASEEDLARLLASRSRPTGLVTYADTFAAKAKHVAEQAGLRIPQDLSVVGFDNMWFTSLPEFDLTTVAQPQRDIGRVAMDMLLARLRGQAAESRLLAPSLVVRGSTAAPAGSRRKEDRKSGRLRGVRCQDTRTSR